MYSNLSTIMEMSMGSHTNYISTAKENELVNGTILILKEAKLRKKNKVPPKSLCSPSASPAKPKPSPKPNRSLLAPTLPNRTMLLIPRNPKPQ